MKMQQQFRVGSDPETVWEYFQDVAAVADCLPGAELTEQLDDETYRGKITTKLGPVTATFEGEAVVRPEPATKSGSMQGKGVDKKGGSRGEIAVDYRLRGDNGATIVELDADIKLGGAAARFGRGALLEEITRRLLTEFTTCVESRLTATASDGDDDELQPSQTPRTELRGGSLMLKSILGATARVLARPFVALRRRFSTNKG